MSKLIDITGQRFGKLTAIDYINNGRWKCKCDCGNEKIISGTDLRKGSTKSCGCLCKEDRKKHGHARKRDVSKTYRIWSNMKTRCSNPKHIWYKNYGGRGIIVCERWQIFENFLEDMGECPKGYQIDRLNNNGNYEPGNCKYIPLENQAFNRRNNIDIEFNGVKKNIKEWANDLGINYHTLRYRIKNGWPIEKAFKA